MDSLSEKRKRKVLTIDEKLEIVSLLDKNHSLAVVIASKYRFGKSTFSDWQDYHQSSRVLSLSVVQSIKYNFQLSE